MGFQCKARRRSLAPCQARSRNAAMGAQWPEPCGLCPNGPATALRSLPRGLAIGGVARLVAEPFGRNAIPRRDCQQTLGLTETQAMGEGNSAAGQCRPAPVMFELGK